MTGVVFIVNIPKKEYEASLTKNIPDLIVENEKLLNSNLKVNEIGRKKKIYAKDDSDVDKYKCQSIGCLYDMKVNDKSNYKSENTLGGVHGDNRKSYVKRSWEDVKQILKRGNKIEITKPVRVVDILEAFSQDTPLETKLSEVILWLDIKNAAWHSSKDSQFWQVIFSIESGSLSEEVLQVLRTFGIGTKHQSSVSVLPCSLYYKSNEPTSISEVEIEKNNRESNTWSQFSSSVRARNNLARVLHDVRAGSALTFDWLFLLLVAAFVAAVGLIENSTVIIVASMLISPLMGPVIGGTLGTAVNDRSLQMMGLKNEFIGVFLSQAVGFIFGLTICFIDARYGVVDDWPTYEMLSRCEYRSLWVGILIAIPTGAGVALAVLGEYTSSFVGVAISASLLPPAVNAGLLWAMAVTQALSPATELRWVVVDTSDLAKLGTVSLCLTLVNIGCLFLAGVAVFKVKEVCPLEKKDITWWKANKNQNQASNLMHPNNSNWGMFYDSQQYTATSRPTKDSLPEHFIDSSTVTFRKRPSYIRKLRAQNIEGFCCNGFLLDDYPGLSLNSEIKVTKNDEKETLCNGSEASTLPSYCNLAYQTDDSSLPTIDPSTNYTVDAQNYKINSVINNHSIV